jgi:hypothetical protein
LPAHPDDLTWRVDEMIARLDAGIDAGRGASVEDLLAGDGPYDPDEPEYHGLEERLHTHGLSERAQDAVMAWWLATISLGREPRQGRMIFFSTPQTADDAYRRLLEQEAAAGNPDAQAARGPIRGTRPDWLVADDLPGHTCTENCDPPR